MDYATITSGLITLLGIIAFFLILKHWKAGAWAEVLSVLGIVAVCWAMLSGKDIFSIVWDFLTGFLNVFGVNVK